MDLPASRFVRRQTLLFRSFQILLCHAEPSVGRFSLSDIHQKVKFSTSVKLDCSAFHLQASEFCRWPMFWTSNLCSVICSFYFLIESVVKHQIVSRQHHHTPLPSRSLIGPECYILLSVADISTNDPWFGPPLHMCMLSFCCSPTCNIYRVCQKFLANFDAL